MIVRTCASIRIDVTDTLRISVFIDLQCVKFIRRRRDRPSPTFVRSSVISRAITVMLSLPSTEKPRGRASSQVYLILCGSSTKHSADWVRFR
jgi:hypothetical protein